MSAEATQPMTIAGHAYQAENNRLLYLLDLLTNQEHPSDGIGLHPAGTDAFPFDSKTGTVAVTEFPGSNTFFQMFLARASDNYGVYLSELLTEIDIRRPEVLRARQQVPADEILSCDPIESLVRTGAETEVRSLSKGSLEKLDDYLRTQLGFTLFDSATKFDKIAEVLAVRQLITHKRGVADKHFAQRVKQLGWQGGETVPLTANYVLEAIRALQASVTEIDSRAIGEFGLDTAAI